jgi:hypothetical protein
MLLASPCVWSPSAPPSSFSPGCCRTSPAPASSLPQPVRRHVDHFLPRPPRQRQAAVRGRPSPRGGTCHAAHDATSVPTQAWGPGTTIRSQTYPEALLRYGLTEGLEMRVGQNTSTQQTVGVESPAPLRGAQDQELGVKLALATPHTLRGKSSCGSWPRASTAWRLQFGVSSQKATVWKGV